jgi:outer membrane autotransporter protein
LSITDDANIVYEPHGNKFIGIHVTGTLADDPTAGASLSGQNITLDLTADRADTEKMGLHIDNGAVFTAEDLKIDIALNNSTASVGYGVVVGSGQYNSVPSVLDPAVDFARVELNNLEITIDNSQSTQREAVAAGIRSAQYVSSSGRVGTSGYLTVSGTTTIETDGYYSLGVFISGGDSQVHLNDSVITTKGYLSHALKLGKDRPVLTGSAKFYSKGRMEIDTTGAADTASILVMGDGSLLDAGSSGSSGVVRSANIAVHFANDEGLASSPVRSTSDGVSAVFRDTVFETTSSVGSLFKVDAGQTNATLTLEGSATLASASDGGWLMEVQDATDWESHAASATLTVQHGAKVVGMTTHGGSDSDLDIVLDTAAVWKLAERDGSFETRFTTLNLESGAVLDASGDGAGPASFAAFGALNNGSGLVTLANSSAGDTFTLQGNYTGGDLSIIDIDVALGGDLSSKDLLHIEGNSAGHGRVKVNNIGGGGLQTLDGIEVIHVAGDSDADFSLLGDYLHEGEQAVVAGAFAYKLYQGATSAPDDGNWYLRSTLLRDVPLYQPGVPIYESYAQTLLGLNSLATLQQRVGNRFWGGGQSDAFLSQSAAEGNRSFADSSGIWGRVEARHSRVTPRYSDALADSSQDVLKMQAGGDILIAESETGNLIGGLTIHYAHGSSDVRSVYGGGGVSTEGYGFGGTLTWYGSNGFYLDAQAQGTWYRSDLTSDLAGSLARDNDGLGYAFSAEAGRRIVMSSGLTLTPQAQLIYSKVRFDSFSDIWGADVHLDRGDSLQGRVGLSLDHEETWANENGLTIRKHVYGLANLYYGFSEGTRVVVEGVPFTQEKDRFWGGIGIGGSYNWSQDKYSIYGEGLANTSLSNLGDSYAVQGQVGFRMAW